MKKLLLRLPVLIIGIPASYWLLVMGGNLVRVIFLLVVAILGQWELSSMLDKKLRKPIFESVASVLIMASTFFFGEKGLIASFSVSVILAMVSTVFRGLKGDGTRHFNHILFSLFYLPFCLSCFYLLSISSYNSVNFSGKDLFIILASVWALDIGAYAFGMTLRGPKLAPNISPNKTISGAIGGFLCSVAFLHCAAHYGWTALPTSRVIYAAFAIGILGQVADLFESVIKRESDTKDSGSLLGEHGGVLDRIDSVLFLGPLSYFLFTL